MTAIKNLSYLKLLEEYCKKTPIQFKTLIKNSSNNELKAVCELILNILHGKLPVSNVNKLKRYEIKLRHLTTGNLSSIERKSYITCGRGFMLPLLSLGIPALIRLFKK